MEIELYGGTLAWYKLDSQHKTVKQMISSAKPHYFDNFYLNNERTKRLHLRRHVSNLEMISQIEKVGWMLSETVVGELG